MSQFAELANTTVGIGVCGSIRERVIGASRAFRRMIAIDDRNVQGSRATEWLLSNGENLLMPYSLVLYVTPSLCIYF